ncbi:DUF6707 family protein [Sinomonas sp. G460-2]|uniref:DUF6707 family protein n=1 Tax=Sinomonas sp. G460-2 TaxID=3393464 RepID=UPI0039EE8F1F
MQYSPETEPSGSMPPGAERLLEIEASELSPGQRLVLPDGETTANVLDVDAVLDDYEQPALYFAALDNHVNLRVAHGTVVRIVVPKPSRPADLLFAGPKPPEAGDAASEPETPSPKREGGRADLLRRALGLANPRDNEVPSGDAEAPLNAAESPRLAAAPATDDGGEPQGGSAQSASSEAESASLAGTVPESGHEKPSHDDAGGTSFLDDAAFDADSHDDERPPTRITLDTGDVVVVPGKSRSEATGPTAAQLGLIPPLEGNPEDLIRHIDATHPGRHAVHELSERLARGVNMKSGACLKDLRDLSFELYLGQRDADDSLKVADILAVLPFDGNPGRWSSVESALALAAHLARERNEEGRAEVYGELLRAPETAETDPFRAQMAARVRQRTLNEPNLYDKEVTRAANAGDEAEERSWRILRLDTLLHLRAHGGSEVYDDDELDRRIRIELDAVAR